MRHPLGALAALVVVLVGCPSPNPHTKEVSQDSWHGEVVVHERRFGGNLTRYHYADGSVGWYLHLRPRGLVKADPLDLTCQGCWLSANDSDHDSVWDVIEYNQYPNVTLSFGPTWLERKNGEWVDRHGDATTPPSLEPEKLASILELLDAMRRELQATGTLGEEPPPAP